jgi:hypothetical protein
MIGLALLLKLTFPVNLLFSSFSEEPKSAEKQQKRPFPKTIRSSAIQLPESIEAAELSDEIQPKQGPFGPGFERLRQRRPEEERI